MQNYDGYYPQYQFASGGLMQALSPNQATYDPKFMQDSFLQKLLMEQTKQQILNAFVPGGGQGAPGGASAPGAGGMSYLEQLLASTPTPAAPPAPQPVAPPVQAPAPVQTSGKKRRMTNDYEDRYGSAGFL